MNKELGIPTLLAVYLGVLGLIALGGSYAYTRISPPGVAAGVSSSERQTILSGRLKNAREIKAALAKPLPKTKPLPPIMAKPEHALTQAAVSDPEGKKARASDMARNAFAQGNLFQVPSASASYDAPRYSPPDRGSAGGW
jgi:hypothetical protein